MFFEMTVALIKLRYKVLNYDPARIEFSDAA
jgi:hypothetical protein